MLPDCQCDAEYINFYDVCVFFCSVGVNVVYKLQFFYIYMCCFIARFEYMQFQKI